MKKILLSIICLLTLFVSKTYATHLMGGQITVEHLGTDSTLVKLTVYRDTIGIPMDTTQSFDVYADSFCTAPVAIVGFDFNGFSNIGNGVEEYIFTATLGPSSPFYLSDSATADYFLKWTNCCRNMAISNIPSAGSFNMVLQTQYHVFGPTFVNSTPVFLNQPVTTAEINLPWNYNPLPFDADADSLYWYLDQPWTDCQTPCTGYTMPSADPLGPFTIDPLTGQISWTPNMLGNWNATVMVDEYRAGVKVGFIRRDMQIIVLDSTAFGTGTKPAININGTTVPSSQFLQFSIPANYNFTMAADAVDIDGNDLKFTMQGEPFILASNAATSVINNGTGMASASMFWLPTSTQVRKDPYTMAVRTFEKNPASVYVKVSDITVQLEVFESPTAVNDLTKNSGLMVSPVPANDYTTLQFNSQVNGKATIQITDMTGKIVSAYTLTAQVGSNGMVLPTAQLPNGVYLVNLISKEGKASTKLSVQH